ncbi:family 10 glycosylhydrolase [Deinococcus sp.]|uniref:family 10 glycosylhydrolase n=1 Tax=Deinococcus sp. TaxID=47478 RepID=UPI003CC5D40A
MRPLPLFATLTLGLFGQAAAQPGPPTNRLALWLRPPATAQALDATLSAAKRAGFTDVLLEGFYHGRAIWTSKIAPANLSYDALAVASAAAQREGLTLNVWFETLYWRPADSFGIPVTPLWKDDLATLSREGKTSLDLSKLGFVDPAAPGVSEVLTGLTAELGRLYPGVGLHLDYLRYPREADFGYHPAALAGFKAQTGLDPRSFPDSDPGGEFSQARASWTQYRQSMITGLATRLIASYRAAGGTGLVSAAVYGGNDPLQNWREWQGLDAAMPMLYYPLLFLYQFAPLRFAPGPNLWPGIQVGAGKPSLAEQLELLHRLGYPNVSVFGWEAGTPTPNGVQTSAALSSPGFR